MSTLSKASLDGIALAMMSNTYFFELKNPIHPLLKTIGNARVTAVVINESSQPELLLHAEGQEPEFHHFNELKFSPVLSAAV